MDTEQAIDSAQLGKAQEPEVERVAVPQMGNGFPPLTDRKQPADLADEQLAKVVSDGLVKLAVDSERLKPYFFELRQRFHKKQATAKIHGCRTWDELCTKVLKRTRRAVNYLLAGGNPTSKRNSKDGTGQQSTAVASSVENGKTTFAIAHSPIDGDPALAKQDASRQIVAWSLSRLKTFPPAEKREIAEDVTAKLRDEMMFEAPQPPPIEGDPDPEPGKTDQRFNNFHRGNPKNGKHLWLTPPELLARIKAEFGELHDPCPYPKPDDYDGLAADWDDVNYVNPPFGSVMGDDGKKKGMTAWVRKAIEEQQKGKTTVLVFPQDGWVHMLLEAGAEFRSLGQVEWEATEDRSCAKGNSRPIMMFILRGRAINRPPQ